MDIGELRRKIPVFQGRAKLGASGLVPIIDRAAPRPRMPKSLTPDSHPVDPEPSADVDPGEER